MENKKGKKTALKVSRSARAGTLFPVGRIHRHLRKGGYADRIGGVSAVYLASVLEYLTAEVLELATEECHQAKRHIIQPRHIMLAVKKDAELDELFKGVIISNGGVMPGIQEVLLPKRERNKNQKNGDSDSEN